ncbi:hypothetical protein [Limnoglobus roseus]|uniref:Uncharacterized protein n=1 Tax=Limnoglobus roseus TaxID=2598579 RepID=A0A5C1AG29_9BACT|nr:hypothetical protein [Limnoglobus roseus]QEL17585.1 hypothetical protein PX52LOC_04581 [Limnoglobus roseus]
MAGEDDYDSPAWVAGDALAGDGPFDIFCSQCSAGFPVTPPLPSAVVVCPRCGWRVRLEIVPGDPGYMLLLNPLSGAEYLTRLAGSKSPPLSALSPEEMAQIRAELRGRQSPP